MATCIFRSALAPRLHAFWEARRSARRGDAMLKTLRSIDRFFITELKPGQPISRELLARWIESTAHRSAGTRINRFGIMRQFCLYMSYFEPRTCLLHRHCLPRRNRPAPHIYTPQEVRRIMVAARTLGPRGSLRPRVISTVIGFLYATGLRIGEALNLTLADVDLRRRVIEVRRGKFGKSRYVPLSVSTAAEIGAYLRQRRRAGFSTTPDAPVFVNVIGNRHGHPGFVTVYLDILRGLDLRGPTGQRGPRVHDLRHTFAVHRLLRWYRQGVNLGTKLPLLSTYLGHSTVTGTEVYLHATAQLLESAGRRFHSHFAVPPVAKRTTHGEA
ncbi:MAG: integrase family protein [candidate division NC10 bacterium]|nr:integrase family protein [candidate division NC10 bacterium]